MRNLAILGLGLAALGGCGGDGGPVNVEGEYTISVANQENGCSLANWDEDGTATGIPVSVSQNGEAANAEVGGASGIALNLWLGSNVFVGSVNGANLDLEIEGENEMTTGNCDYHYIAIIDARLEGDVLEGEIRYEAVTDGASDCGALDGCSSVQDFNGTRPPQ
jgi:hypothetical protein